MATLFNTKIKDTYQSLLKLEDNTILTTTSKNITDGLGNASPLYMSTTRIGIGTNAPAGTLQIKGIGNTASTTSFSVINSSGIQGLAVSDDGTAYAGWDSTGGTNSYFSANGDVGLGRYGLGLTYIKSTGAVKLQSNNFEFASGSLYMSNSSLLSTGSAGFGVSPSLARLQVKGSGSTSATTSLLVQNSAGTELFRVRDDGNFNLQNGYLYWNGISFGSYLGSDGYDMYYNTRQDTKAHHFYSGGVEFVRFVKNSSSDIRVIINGSTGYASAILSADSTTQGFLPPRMLQTQRTAIASPAVGLIVYQTDATEGLYIYKSTGWTFIV